MKRASRGRASAWAALFGIAIAAVSCLGVDAASAQARRAFLVGEQRYSDQDIPSLTRSDNDANDLASDLEQVGFDKKNITLATELRGKSDFDKRFQAFLATVKEGDVVLFFYSGHGLGVEANNTDYLLLGDIKSLRTYTRDQVIEADKRRDDIISLKMASFEGAYETDEIAKNGVSVNDVMNAIADKKPKVAILLLDACRSIIRATTDEREMKRGLTSGSRLLQPKDVPAGSIVVFSASFGETAIESFGFGDHRRNSLFTEVVRSELQRPRSINVCPGRCSSERTTSVKRELRRWSPNPKLSIAISPKEAEKTTIEPAGTSLGCRRRLPEVRPRLISRSSVVARMIERHASRRRIATFGFLSAIAFITSLTEMPFLAISSVS